jgi:hypothetical protein
MSKKRYQQFYMQRVTSALMSTKWLITQQFHMHQQFYMPPVTSALMSTKRPITGFILTWAATFLLFSINLSSAYSLPLLYNSTNHSPSVVPYVGKLKLPQFKICDPPVVYISISLAISNLLPRLLPLSNFNPSPDPDPV